MWQWLDVWFLVFWTDVTVAGRVALGILNVLESFETSRITCLITWVFKILHDRDSNHIVCALCSCSVTLCVVVDIVRWNCVLHRNGGMLTANILATTVLETGVILKGVSWPDALVCVTFMSRKTTPATYTLCYNVSSTKCVSCDGSISGIGFVVCENSGHQHGECVQYVSFICGSCILVVVLAQIGWC
jgi:hypothetical protein